ncbi:hypothetical protein BX666DRAFT_1848451 [Dichotomocladium elegans]|nr:hypothetical protein BX666DRAFT_1848451 [Dichotomocladium elegans]
MNEMTSPSSIALKLRSCVEMFDQEYMVKESIFSILSTRGYFTQQHLNGSAAIWAAEPYIDRGRVNALIEDKDDQ